MDGRALNVVSRVLLGASLHTRISTRADSARVAPCTDLDMQREAERHIDVVARRVRVPCSDREKQKAGGTLPRHERRVNFLFFVCVDSA